MIALTPPSREAILGHRRARTAGCCFGQTGTAGLSQPTRSSYRAQVLARAGFSFDFGLATKYWCVHYMHATLGPPP